ncbi:SAF domain-containing protein [Nitratireductor sp. XY-223]|uniref:SAF domain-containing protein n=1 Tax=Nitratireductor sp. XY-223 TaxID=2561926 RepID=UPI0010AA7A6C|nr:SAF domain-containing protein [Nitratireductor sp. XY-223]
MTDTSENLEYRPDGPTVRIRLLTPVFVTAILALWAAVLSHEILGSDRLRPLTVYVEAARDIGKGQKITNEDLYVKLARRPDKKHKLVTQPRQAVGLVTNSLIKGGQPLLRADLAPPPKKPDGGGKDGGGLIDGDRLAVLADIANMLVAVLPRVVVMAPETVDDGTVTQPIPPTQRLSDALKTIRLMREIIVELRKFPGMGENEEGSQTSEQPPADTKEFETLLEVLEEIEDKLGAIQSAIETGGDKEAGNGESSVPDEKLDELRRLLEQLQAGSSGKSSLVDNIAKLVTAGGTAWAQITSSGEQVTENAFVEAYKRELGKIAAGRTDDLLSAVARRIFGVLTGQSKPPMGPKSREILLHYTDPRDLITGEQSDSLLVLTDIARHMPDDVNCLFLVTGHADATGNDALNLQISKDRAETVADRLVYELAGAGYAKSTDLYGSLWKSDKERRNTVNSELYSEDEKGKKMIVVTWWGERRLAEWTDDGADKQSNRRVEVEFHCNAPLVLPSEQE